MKQYQNKTVFGLENLSGNFEQTNMKKNLCLSMGISRNRYLQLVSLFCNLVSDLFLCRVGA